MFANHKIIFSVGILLLLSGGVYYAIPQSNPLDDIETSVVQRQTVENIVSETGVVEAGSQATLGFSAGGRVVEVAVEEGEVVQGGDVLARLESRSAQAAVEQAEAGLSRERAVLSRQLSVDEASVAAAQEKLTAAEENLQQVIQTQNELVKSARENLYTSNLQPYLVEGEDEGSDDDFTPPTVTGTYEGREPGEYRLDLYRSQAPSGWSFRTSGLESDVGRVSTSLSQPLGTRGLFITFPNNFAARLDIQWVLQIPNTRAATYTTLKNTLEQAENTRDSAISAAENAVDNAEAALAQARSQAESDVMSRRDFEITSQEAAVESARAQLRQAESVLEDRILRAPFDGVVADTNISIGESVTAGQPVMEVISDDLLKITVQVPEVDTSQIDIGDPAEISFTAYDNQVFNGSVASISPVAVVTEGVRTVEVTILFTDDDIPVRSGLSADVDITARVAENVIAIPGRSLQRDQDTDAYYVYLRQSNGEYRVQEITLGTRGSDGFVEVRSGLSVGEEVATFIDSEAREVLNNRTTQ